MSEIQKSLGFIKIMICEWLSKNFADLLPEIMNTFNAVHNFYLRKISQKSQ